MTLLTNKTIIVTRAGESGLNLCDLIRKQGGNAIFFPTITFGPPLDLEHCQEGVNSLPQQDWAIFNSPQSVKTLLPYLTSPWPSQCKIAAIGAGTAKTLIENNLKPTVYPEKDWHSEGLLALACFKQVAGLSIAIIRGEGGRLFIDKELSDRGALVTPIITYSRQLPQIKTEWITPIFLNHKIDGIIASSFEAIQHLKQLTSPYWPILQSIPLIVSSERLQRLSQALGFRNLLVSKDLTSAALFKVLYDYI